MYKKYEQIINYLIFGILTTLINYLAFKTLNIIGIYDLVSNAIAWIISVLFAYYTNRKYVFKSNNANKKNEMSKFFLARISSFIIDMLLMFILLKILFINEDISKLLTNGVVIIINYLLSKIMVFKNS